MVSVVSSTELLRRFHEIEAQADSGAFDLDGRHEPALSRFFDQVLPETDPQVLTLSASLIRLGFADPQGGYELALTGSGIGPVGSLDALTQAIGEGLASGRLDTLTLSRQGVPILGLAIGSDAWTLTSGIDSFTVSGAMPTTFEQLYELAGLLSRADFNHLPDMTAAERAALFADLADYGVTGLRLASGGTQILDLSVDEGAAVLSLGGLTLTVTGTFPEDFGALASALYNLDLAFGAGEGFDLSRVEGLGIDGAILRDTATGATLLSLTGPVTDGSVAAHRIDGTAGNDVLLLRDMPLLDADRVAVDLGGGADRLILDLSDHYAAAHWQGAPLWQEAALSGGAGPGNQLVLQNFHRGSLVEVDLSRGLIRGHHEAPGAAPLYTMALSGFRQIFLEGQGYAVKGGGDNDTVLISDDFWGEGLRFEGGAGTDILDLSTVFAKGETAYFHGLTRADLAGYDLAPTGDGGIRLSWTVAGRYAPDLELHGVEWLRVLQNGTTATVELVGLNSLIPTSTTLTGQEAGPVHGTWLDETFIGSDRDDAIHGHDGSDRLFGGAGNDTLYGGDGADTLNGGDGDDFLFGGTTEADVRDVIYGGEGDDWIDGGAGNDELHGGNGHDTIVGGLGSDSIYGNAGDDQISGGGGSDLIFGGEGNDWINGGFGFDRLNGGAGADTFFHQGVADHGSDWIQDYSFAEGDVLAVGIAGATRAQFQVNFANTPGAGAADVAEAFVIHRPTGQILFALVDGAGQDGIWLRLGGQDFDLLA